MCAIAEKVEQVQKHLYHLAEYAKEDKFIKALDEAQLAKQKLQDLMYYVWHHHHTSGTTG